MAQEIIYKKILKSIEQEEIVVDNILQQEYVKAWIELVVKQEQVPDENRSELFFELWGYAQSKELDANVNDENNNAGFTMFGNNGTSGVAAHSILFDERLRQLYPVGTDDRITVNPGDGIKSVLLHSFYTNGKNYYGKDKNITVVGSSTKREMKYYHNLDGTAPSFNLVVDAELSLLYVLKNNDSTSIKVNVVNTTINSSEFNIQSIKRGDVISTAVSFSDEENPAFSYSVPASCGVFVESYTGNEKHKNWIYAPFLTDTANSIRAALSLDGITADVQYREIPLNGSSYTFNLTDEERETLRIKAQGSNHVPIYYLVELNRGTSAANINFIGSLERILTIIGCEPTLNPSVVDIKPETIALTGNANIFVRYESMVEFSTGATASKHASIVSQSVQCGSKTIYNLYNGIIDDIESGSFIFNASDSRGLHANQVVITNAAIIEYIKPTISQVVEIELSGETGAAITVSVKGNCFNGTFGAVDNELILQVRYSSGKNELGEWFNLSGTPTFNGNTYELTAVFSGLKYDSSYTFQCRAIDKLNVVETQSYTIKLLPVFDWSETDFNFNVPVNIDADSLNMHNETIIRHNAAANNTVIAATGGHIYLRPGGTNNTTGETVINPDGSIKFGGSVDLSESLVDYIVESGEQEMGSNGTWYWRKWASGKAECYGCRNFGNMAVNTAWGGLFRSAILTQDLPDDVFVRTPDSININIVNANFGGWICKHEQTAPSAATTGSFIFVRPASATVSPTYIGFYVIGDWI